MFVTIVLALATYYLWLFTRRFRTIHEFDWPRTARVLSRRPSVASARIPWVLHKTGPRPLHCPGMRALRRQWAQLDTPVRYYDDDDCVAFITEHFGDRVRRAYHALLPTAYRADLFRYCVLYAHGGIYGDLSQKYNVPLRSLVNPDVDELVLTADRFQDGVQIAFMACSPRHPVMHAAVLQVVANVEQRYYGQTPFDVTGPRVLGRIVQESNCRARVALHEVGYDYWEGQGGIAVMATGRIAIYTKQPNHHHLLNNTSHSYKDMWTRRGVYADHYPS